ncbi:MAG: glutamate-5-semialdehyde dehydrogenase [Candidatus Omnitrophota bacterium]
MDHSLEMKKITDRAKKAAAVLSCMTTEDKDRVLLAMAEGLGKFSGRIKEANNRDLIEAKKGLKNKAFLDRLKLDDKRIDGMRAMMREVAALKDPVGEVIERTSRPNGLVIEKVRVPIGVIGIIYEARPNVTADCVALCLKSGNAVILRGGSDAINTNKAIYEAMSDAGKRSGLADGSFILIEDTSRELVDAMLYASDGIDLIMPRGGESLIREVVRKSRVPVIKHYKGICHVYVDSEADLDMAERICLNAKVQRPGVCNSMETMLVHRDIARVFLPRIALKMEASGVELKGCPETRKILGGGAGEAGDKEYSTEWLDLVLNIRVVGSLEEALEHIAKYGSKHSDSIVTSNRSKGIEFTKKVDSAAVYVNASTRFTDGGEFGKGAEIGISTDKIHARGPMGLAELTTYKYVIYGNGQVRS